MYSPGRKNSCGYSDMKRSSFSLRAFEVEDSAAPRTTLLKFRSPASMWNWRLTVQQRRKKGFKTAILDITPSPTHRINFVNNLCRVLKKQGSKFILRAVFFTLIVSKRKAILVKISHWWFHGEWNYRYKSRADPFSILWHKMISSLGSCCEQMLLMKGGKCCRMYWSLLSDMLYSGVGLCIYYMLFYSLILQPIENWIM